MSKLSITPMTNNLSIAFTTTDEGRRGQTTPKFTPRYYETIQAKFHVYDAPLYLGNTKTLRTDVLSIAFTPIDEVKLGNER